jgi:uncharacterized membrane protein
MNPTSLSAKFDKGTVPREYSHGAMWQLDAHYHKPRTVHELTERNVEAVVAMEEAARARRTHADRIADVISGFCGSMWFVWMHIAWFVIWISLNTLPELKAHRFDPFPFTFLTLVVSLEAIFLSAFIMISQNSQTRLSERRNHLDLQINLLSEQENTKMLHLLSAIAKQVGAQVDDDPSISILEQATRPDQLLKQIDESIERGETPDSAASPLAETRAA